MFQKHNQRLDEKGFASVVIALVLIIVLSLLTVGFAQLARHEQQDALNKQLASQANYAAETGINDAYKDIIAGKINLANTTGVNANKCLTRAGTGSGSQSLPNDALTARPVIDSNTDVSYSCVLVDLTPQTLTFDDITPDSGQHATFGTTTPLSSITFNWGSSEQQNNFPASPATQFPPSGAWHDGANRPYAPVLMMSITPLIPGLTTNNNDTLANYTLSYYLYPASSGGAGCTVLGKPSSCVNVNPGDQGRIVSGNCNTANSADYPCSVTLIAPSGPVPANGYLIRFYAFYANNPAQLLITGNSGGTSTRFTGEPQVDVTGRAKNVLKRSRVRFLTSGATGGADSTIVLPSSAIEAQNICKRFGTEPNSTTYDGATSAACNLSQ